MWRYAAYLSDSNHLQTVRMQAVAHSFFVENRSYLLRMIGVNEKDGCIMGTPVLHSYFMIYLFKALWQMGVFKGMIAQDMIAFLHTTFDLGFEVSSLRTVWYDDPVLVNQFERALRILLK